MRASLDHVGLGGRDKARRARFRIWVLLAVPLAAVLFQVYVPLFLSVVSYLDVPLLVTVYFSVMWRNPLAGIFFGASIGLVQDSLSSQPLGMFGIVKTLVGYGCSSMGTRLDAGHAFVRIFLCFLFFLFHQVVHWLLRWGLLGQQMPPDVAQTFALAFLNAGVAVPVYYVLDRLKGTD